MEILLPVLVFAALSALLGIALGVCSKLLYVETDPREEVITTMLPGANCGGCGYPGCGGLATALVEGTVAKVSTCPVSNAEQRGNIVTYLNETPGPDGVCVKVTA